MATSHYEKMREAQNRFHAKAIAIPGVHATSIGSKQVGGDSTGILAITIHLTQKRPLSDVPAEERIPKEIEGFPTDVIEHPQIRSVLTVPSAPSTEALNDNADKYRPMQGGCQIQVGKMIGTLGCGVLDLKDGSRSILSCAHVLLEGETVYQPTTWHQHRIGDVKRTVFSSQVDGGIAAIDYYSDEVTNDILGIGKITGIFDLKDKYPMYQDFIKDFPLGYPVKKCGRTTGVTSGKITHVNYNCTDDNKEFGKSRSVYGQLYIKGDVQRFADHGDSGAVIVDNQNRVVGLLWLADPILGFGIAAPIKQVMNELNIEVLTT